jgi:uncharacterized protein
MRILKTVLAAALLYAPLATPAASQEAGLVGGWGGALEVQAIRLRLTLEVVASEGDGAPTARLTSVDQGGTAFPATVTVTADSAIFEVANIGAAFRAARVGRDTLRGVWTQGGGILPLTMVRGANVAMVVRRPQNPQPPHPYRTEEVAVESDPGVRLAGTLTIPQGAGPHPAVFLITGSGPQDRDEEIFGHRPFRVLADHLTRNGIAVLRVDDRGTAGSTGSFPGSTSEDFARDAMAAVRFLRARPEVAADRVGLIGHSEGGMIAPMVASRMPEVAFAVLLAGPGIGGAELLEMQGALIARAGGAPDSLVRRSAAVQHEMFAAIIAMDDSTSLHARLREIGARLLASMTPEERAAAEGDLERGIGQLMTRWTRWFLRYDPAPALRGTRVPVLALNGALDLQVPPDEDLAGIEQALRAGGNRDVTVEKLPGLNHLFQPATTGAPSEYAEIEQTMDPVVLDRITAWILQRFGPGRR